MSLPSLPILPASTVCLVRELNQCEPGSQDHFELFHIWRPGRRIRPEECIIRLMR
jgi:hypothetical protein